MPSTHFIRRSITLRFLILASFAFALLPLSLAEAAKVSRAKGRTVEIEMSAGDDFVKGDRANVIGSSGKPVGYLRIVKIKAGKKALAKLEKGKAPIGASVVLKAGTAGSDKASAPSKSKDEPANPSSDIIIGALVGFDIDSQSVKASSSNGSVTESVSMSGSGFSAKAYADISLGDEFGVIGRFGLETFKVTGTSTNLLCQSGTSQNCETTITYLSGDLLARYNFSPGTLNPYAAAGLGIYFPLSKKTNILDETKIASTTVFLLGGGIHWNIGSLYIPVSIDYGIFPPSNQVSTNFIAGRAGLGWNW